MAKLISKTYADALFELAIEENQTVSFRQEVESLLQILKDNEEFHKFMNHPKIPKEEKKAALENIFLSLICIGILLNRSIIQI